MVSNGDSSAWWKGPSARVPVVHPPRRLARRLAVDGRPRRWRAGHARSPPTSSRHVRPRLPGVLRGRGALQRGCATPPGPRREAARLHGPRRRRARGRPELWHRVVRGRGPLPRGAGGAGLAAWCAHEPTASPWRSTSSARSPPGLEHHARRSKRSGSHAEVRPRLTGLLVDLGRPAAPRSTGASGSTIPWSAAARSRSAPRHCGSGG